MSAEDIINKLRNALIKKGNYGIRGLGKVFFNLDEFKSRYIIILITKYFSKEKMLDFDDFKWGLRNYGLFLNDEV